MASSFTTRQPLRLVSRPGVVVRSSGFGVVPMATMTASAHHDEFAALDGRDARAAGGVGLTELHAHALEADDLAVDIAEYLDGVIQQAELDALFLGVVDFLGAGGQLVSAAAVDDEHLVGAHALGAAGGVHGHVAGADDGDALRVGLYRRVVVVAVGLHEVYTGEVLVGGVDAEQVLARDVQELGQGPRRSR